MRELLDMGDRMMLGWTYWSYDPWGWGIWESDADGGFVAERENAEALVRPYPQRVAGIPRSFSYDPDTRIFELAFDPSPIRNRPDRDIPSRGPPLRRRLVARGLRGSGRLLHDLGRGDRNAANPDAQSNLQSRNPDRPIRLKSCYHPLTMSKLEGKRVLITGGAQGIGFEMAIKFAERGAEIVLADIDRRKARRGQGHSSRSAASRPRAFASTSPTRASIASLRAQINAEVGPIDVLVNNAGVVFGGPFTKTSLDDHFKTYEVNVLGLVAMTHAFSTIWSRALKLTSYTSRAHRDSSASRTGPRTHRASGR